MKIAEKESFILSKKDMMKDKQSYNKITFMYLCVECDEVFSAYGMKKPLRCPSCTNSVVIPLQKLEQDCREDKKQ
jgi:DNA-directed RNA polymerase subunit RPC12/RpoP